MLILEKGHNHTNTNLESFLDSVTAIVPSQFLSKIEMKGVNRLWHPCEKEKLEYFTLSDLWNCFDEWSAYGVGVPITLQNGETVIQYYVPYLSAIQIFTTNSSAKLLSCREEMESVSETRDSFSDSYSEESEGDKSRWDGSCSEEGASSEQDSICPLNDRLGYLYFHYFETSSPFGRLPLMDKISSLAERYPGLMSLRSVDLSPASWMSVAWYPIYPIPQGAIVKDLSTSFLTYHTLSSSFQDSDSEDGVESVGKDRDGIRLPPFGLASCKMYGNVWLSNRDGRDRERLVSLVNVADSWLKQLGVQHPDFDHFTGDRRA